MAQTERRYAIDNGVPVEEIVEIVDVNGSPFAAIIINPLAEDTSGAGYLDRGLRKGVVLIDKDGFDKAVEKLNSAAESERKKLLEKEVGEAKTKTAQAQEAYDAAVGAGMPEIVAAGIARTYLATFDTKSNNGQNGAVKK